MEDFVIKSLFTFASAIYLVRVGLRSWGMGRFLWFFIAAAPAWAFFVYMGVIMGVVNIGDYAEAIQPIVLLQYVAPVVAHQLTRKGF